MAEVARTAGGSQRRGRVDAVLVVGGATRGFTVLLLGGVVQPWIGAMLPALGYVWLALVAVAAFAWAARPRSVNGLAPSSARWDRAAVGLCSALGSYALVLPLVLMVASTTPWAQIASTSAVACVVGALAGAFVPRAAD